MQRIALTLLFLISTSAQAGGFFDFNGFYFSDALATTASATSTRMFIDAALGFNIDKKGMYQVGWNYAMYSVAESAASATTTYASTQMGPKFNFYFGRDRQWSLGVAYNIVTSATYETTGSTAEKWKGTAIKADFGYIWSASDSVVFGFRFNYAMATFTEKLINDVTYSTVGYTRTHIYPSLYMGLNF